MQQNHPEINYIRPPRKANPVQVHQLEQPAVPATVQHGQFKQLPPRPPVRNPNPGLTSSGLTSSAFPSSTLIGSPVQRPPVQRPPVQKGSFSISVFDNHGGSYDIRNNDNNSGTNKNGVRFPNFQNQYGSVLHVQAFQSLG